MHTVVKFLGGCVGGCGGGPRLVLRFASVALICVVMVVLVMVMEACSCCCFCFCLFMVKCLDSSLLKSMVPLLLEAIAIDIDGVDLEMAVGLTLRCPRLAFPINGATTFTQYIYVFIEFINVVLYLHLLPLTGFSLGMEVIPSKSPPSFGAATPFFAIVLFGEPIFVVVVLAPGDDVP